MSDVRAAVERLRRVKAGEPLSVVYGGRTDSAMMHRIGPAEHKAFQTDRALLAAAYLALPDRTRVEALMVQLGHAVNANGGRCGVVEGALLGGLSLCNDLLNPERA